MPIFIEDTRVEDRWDIRPKRLTKRAPLFAAARSFSAAGKTAVAGDTKCLTVLQGEVAFAPWGHFDMMGSPDATTCVIAVLASDAGVAVAHFDGGCCKDADMMARFTRGLGDTETGNRLFLVGAYRDLDGEGENVVRGVLETLHGDRRRVHLDLAVIDWLNTVQSAHEKCPVGYKTAAHTAVVIRTAGRPAGPEDYLSLLQPAEFEHRGPVLEPRVLRMMQGPRFTDIYDDVERHFFLQKWTDVFYVQGYDQFLRMSDDAFLHTVSTSPLCERPTFVRDFKGCIQYAIDNCADAFSGRSEGYRLHWVEGRGWLEVGKAQGVIF